MIHIKKRNGRLELFNPEKINKVAERACLGLQNVSASELVIDAHLSLYDKVTTTELDTALILTARQKVVKDPNWSKVAARILLSCIYKEVFKERVDFDTFAEDYRGSFIKTVKNVVKEGRFDKRMLGFDLKKLAAALQPSRDDIFEYVGIQNVYDRYLYRMGDKVVETPQAFYMRVAMGICFEESDPTSKAIELYEVYSQHLASPSTPTLFNSGTINNQLSSCFLSMIDDSVDGIFDGLWQEARKSKHAGGLGFHVSNIRGSGAFIVGTNGKSSGLIPWLKVYNDMLVACDQAGKRAGSGCAYLAAWHVDVEDFIDLRQPTGEERRRCHDMNTALWINDLFIKRVEEDGEWTLFCPSYASHLSELYGESFEKAYFKLEEKRDTLPLTRVVKAKDLWKKILKSLFSTSHPWPTFADNANIRYSNIHEGVLHGSNLCVVGDTQIVIRFGVEERIIQIKDLNFYLDTHPKVEVLSKDLETGEQVFAEISAFALTGESKELIEIKDEETGKTLRCTPEHPVLTKNRGYVKAGELTGEDSLDILI